MSVSKLKFYCASFCPFAQRAWIALLEKKADFDYIEQNPYNKTAEWLAINPRGLVPVLVDKDKKIYESGICVEYVDEICRNDVRLLPQDPYQRAVARMWADFATKKLISPFYAYLVKQDPDEQAKEKQKLLDNLYEFTEAMDKDGPFFQGTSFGFVDIMYAPWAARMFILKCYRGFELPQDQRLERYHKWWNAVRVHPSVKATLQDEEAMLQTYKRYAENTAKSEVAKAINTGTVLP